MKPSIRLLIGLAAVITAGLVWQAIVFNREIDARRILKSRPFSLQTADWLLETGAYKGRPCPSFSHLVIDGGMDIVLMKGADLRLCVTSYMRGRYENIRLSNDIELTRN